MVGGFWKRHSKRGSCLKGAVRWWSDRGEAKAILETKACQQAQVSGKKDQQANVNRLLSSLVMLKGFQGDLQESILGLFSPSLPLKKGYCSCQHYTFQPPRGRTKTLQVSVPCFYIPTLLSLSLWFILLLLFAASKEQSYLAMVCVVFNRSLGALAVSVPCLFVKSFTLFTHSITLH